MSNECVNKVCKKHGLTEHVVESRGYCRCKKCRNRNVINNRRKIKLKLINHFGGKCKICGYCKCQQALQFHHLDPTTKEFNLARGGMTRSWATALKEASKCVLLCANCHVEVTAGVTNLV